MTDKELLKKARIAMSNMEQLIAELKDFKKEFTGTDLNPEGGFFHEMRSFKQNTEKEIKLIKEEVQDVKLKYNTISTGIGIGKWAIGGSLIAFMASNLGDFAHWIKRIFS